MLEIKNFILEDFQLGSGEVLKNLNLEYTTQGVEELDENGKIINAFLYLHGWSGDCTSVERLSSVIGPGKAIDTSKFFVISPTAFGSPGSASPSTTGLGMKFPKYSIKDMVKSHYQLISNGLGVEHLRGIMGTSMGGFQALNWALEYPDFMDFLILNGTSHRISNRMYGVYQLMNQIIMGDCEYKNCNYAQNPVKALEKAAYLSYLWSLSPENYEECFDSRDEFIQGVRDRKADAREWDVNDLVWRNYALLGHDLGDKISRIKIPCLILGIHQDQIVDEKYSINPLHEGLENSELFLYNSIWGHYGCTKDISKTSDAIKEFLTKI
ncbi:MAG: alpha/beta fold hydrolase [Methanobacteriaceae archaeon]|nr:alpha/beta fold hydrolase [Methanobacteriaceae archaeon]